MLYQQTRALDPGFLNVIIGFNFKFSFPGQSSHIYVESILQLYLKPTMYKRIEMYWCGIYEACNAPPHILTIRVPPGGW